MGAQQPAERPANSATKATWLAYVEGRDDIPDKTGTREQLIARVDAVDESEPTTAPGAATADVVTGEDTMSEAERADRARAEEINDGGDPAAVAQVVNPIRAAQDAEGPDSGTSTREFDIKVSQGANIGPATPDEPVAANPGVPANPAGTGGADLGGDLDQPNTGQVAFAGHSGTAPVVHTMIMGREDTPGIGVRAGGFVLTEYGWLPEASAQAPEALSAAGLTAEEVEAINRAGDIGNPEQGRRPNAGLTADEVARVNAAGDQGPAAHRVEVATDDAATSTETREGKGDR
jgi:hypothetical protein